MLTYNVLINHKVHTYSYNMYRYVIIFSVNIFLGIVEFILIFKDFEQKTPPGIFSPSMRSSSL